MVDLEKIAVDTKKLCEELIKDAKLQNGDIIVLGCSSSEIAGQSIGKGTNGEIGAAVVKVALEVTSENGIFLAVQGCEHINRALVIEKEAAKRHNLCIVNVVPVLNAGGACATAAYEQGKDPVMVEHIVADAGIDIGDTCVGMHVKFVQVPVRPSIKEIGKAHVTCLKSRPKLIGGERARYVD